MTREETKQVMFLIANEYENFIPTNKKMLELKVKTWYESLKEYDFDIAQQATIQLLKTFEYGTPKLSHICSILSPKLEQQNLGQEFAERFMYLAQRKGTDNMGDMILREYGDIGYQIWINNKSFAREMTNDDIPTFKAQIRNSFNSMEERRSLGQLVELPFKNNQTIMERLESKKLLEG